ncbi:MAG: DUF1587 domain-containing protein, partial [Pseudomonadota bacterium]
MGRLIPVVCSFALALPAAVLAAPDVPAQLDRYCMGCHNPDDWAGGLDLTSLDPVQVGGDAAVWEKVVRKLRAGMMPPPGKTRPSRKDAVQVATTLEARLDSQAAPSTTPPVLHRLNRTEYANAIRDLFGLAVDAAGLLPPDDASEGFDNVAAGLGLSPALIQGYTSAAMKLSRTAVGDMTASVSTAVYQTPDKLAQDKHLEGLPLGSRGGVRIEHDYPLDGDYHFSVRGSFSIARSGGTIDVALDGRHVDAANLRDFRLPMTAGRHVLSAAIFDTKRSAGVNDIYSVFKAEGAIDSVEIAGPFNARGPGDTESRRRIFKCRPQTQAEESRCAERILVDVATRAFRAPQTSSDIATIL